MSMPVRYIVSITWSSEILCVPGIVHREPRRVHRLHRAHAVALDARNLHQPADGVARHAEVVLHRNLGRVLNRRVVPVQRSDQATRRHRARDAHLALAANLRA